MKEKQTISLVIADDHPLLLKGLFKELTASGYQVLAQATNGALALQHILTLNPTIALLDIEMPVLSGFEVIKLAREKGSKTKFIVLSFHKESDFIWRARHLQINGYLLKEDPFFEVERCINAVVNGEDYFSSAFDKDKPEGVASQFEKLEHLTPSEVKILKLISNASTSHEIASDLGVSVRTVEKHRSNILAKIGIGGSTNALTAWALINRDAIMQL